MSERNPYFSGVSGDVLGVHSYLLKRCLDVGAVLNALPLICIRNTRISGYMTFRFQKNGFQQKTNHSSCSYGYLISYHGYEFTKKNLLHSLKEKQLRPENRPKPTKKEANVCLPTIMFEEELYGRFREYYVSNAPSSCFNSVSRISNKASRASRATS